jgi:hypothetical protein
VTRRGGCERKQWNVTVGRKGRDKGDMGGARGKKEERKTSEAAK